MKVIAIEEHFWCDEYLNHMRSRKGYPRVETVEDENHNRVEMMIPAPGVRPGFDYSVWQKMAVNEARIRMMDEAGVDMQVLSMVAGLEPFDAPEGTALSRIMNDALYKIIQKYPQRFSGLAALATQDPESAAGELERSVKDLGLKGAKINSHTKGGEYLDDPKYRVIFETAERLGVPIYIHPAVPSPDIMKAFAGYSMLTGSVWGYAVDAGLAAMRLIFSGIFDRHPDLKIILGHLGEALPFWSWRLDNRWRNENVNTGLTKKLAKKPSEYLRDNFFFTTSGVFSVPAFLSVYLTSGADKILFAVDHPFEDSAEGVQFLKQLPVSAEDKEKIAHLNTEKLLGL